MKPSVDETHDPAIASWVGSANDRRTDFPIQNLPFGVCQRPRASAPAHICIAIGDYALDLADCVGAGLLPRISSECAHACRADTLNPLMSLGRPEWTLLRRELHNLLRADVSVEKRAAAEKCVTPIRDIDLLMPVKIGDYTDFYASIYHAQNVGALFRPGSPLFPNYKYVPVGYHGRASSIVISGTPIRRPSGQSRPLPTEPPRFGPTQQLDYELEIGFLVGPGNSLGQPIDLDRAEDSIFGACILNDWSARDIQAWESQPLGPFLAKSFATTISPWIVTLEALAPFRVAAFRNEGNPKPLPYLFSEADRSQGGFDIAVEVFILSERMRTAGYAPMILGHSNLHDMYWTPAQMVAHHTSNGCNLRTGDLLGTGTISGNTRDSLGCLLELTRRGNEPFKLPTGELRNFLEDGDEIIMRANCEAQGHARISFGACCGVVQTAR